MNFGDLLISWTIRGGMLLFLIGLVGQLVRRSDQPLSVAVKLIWTTGFVLTVLHVVAAFHFVHHWSHQEAYLATAADTYQVVGFAFGGGVYFNYLFLIVWAGDVYWTWRKPAECARWQRWLAGLARGYLIFIAFNAVVVFKTGWLRIFGLVGTTILLVLVMRRYLPPVGIAIIKKE